MIGIQIIGFSFGLFFIYYTFISYKKKELIAKEYIFWIMAWILFIAIALFPSLLDSIVKYGGFLRALDVLTISGFLFLIAFVFYTYTIIRKTQMQIEIITKELFGKK